MYIISKSQFRVYTRAPHAFHKNINQQYFENLVWLDLIAKR